MYVFRLWVAEMVTEGHRNISNCLSITTKIDLCSPDLMSRARGEGWWVECDDFNWREVMGQKTGNLDSPKMR